ncbi:MAG: hypothetical protein C4313_11245, partial [Thermoflexus sp.]
SDLATWKAVLLQGTLTFCAIWIVALVAHEVGAPTFASPRPAFWPTTSPSSRRYDLCSSL